MARAAEPCRFFVSAVHATGGGAAVATTASVPPSSGGSGALPCDSPKAATGPDDWEDGGGVPPPQATSPPHVAATTTPHPLRMSRPLPFAAGPTLLQEAICRTPSKRVARSAAVLKTWGRGRT